MGVMPLHKVGGFIIVKLGNIVAIKTAPVHHFTIVQGLDFDTEVNHVFISLDVVQNFCVLLFPYFDFFLI